MPNSTVPAKLTWNNGYEIIRTPKTLLSMEMLSAVVLFQALLIGLMLTDKIPEIAPYNRYIGICLVLMFLFLYVSNGQRIPTELMLFAAYWIWAIFSGAFVAQDSDWFMRIVRTNVQAFFLIFTAAGLTILRRDVDVVLIPLIVSILMVAIYGFITGDFTLGEGAFSSERKASLFGNPNGLGIFSVLGSMGILYFWVQSRGLILKLFLGSLTVIFALAIIYSGSRKSFTVLLFFLLLWLWFCYRSYLTRNIFATDFVLIFVVSLYLLVDYVMQGTTMGIRLQASLSNPDVDTTRNLMYIRAWELFKQFPITGVGLGNYTVHSGFATYSHSDYAEVLSTTGIVGFALYFPIYIVLWRGLNQAKTHFKDSLTQYRVGLFKAMILGILALSLGVIVSQSVLAWVLLATAVGYVHYNKDLHHTENILK